LWREEKQRTRRKTLGAWGKPTKNSTHIWHRAGIKPGSHWWEASALTTAPSLLPKISMEDVNRDYYHQAINGMKNIETGRKQNKI